MTQEEKCKFIHEMVQNLENTMIRNVAKMPQEWDGRQLRMYLKDKASEFVFKGTLTRTQVRDYNNDIITRNL